MLWDRMVWIKWIDSSHESGWKDLGEYKPMTHKQMTCESVGFLIGESEHAIEIVQSKHVGGDEYDSLMAIPKVAILEMRDCERKRTRLTN